MIADAESILRIGGMDSYLHIGCGQSSLVFELLKRSIDAYGLDPSADVVALHQAHAPGKFFQGSLTNFPFQEASFGTVIIGSELFSYQGDELVAAFQLLRAVARRNLILYFPPEASSFLAKSHSSMNRIFWEKLAIHAGFRLHPRSMLVVPYQDLEDERLGKFAFFERIPDAANQQFSLNWLLENRDLHMDMLREAGRRSDGHVSRYVLAAGKIRPGDVVLDAACGLGYGTAVLAACSPGARFIGVDLDPDSVAYANANFAASNPAISYKACDVTQLAFLADHSVDTVISFETIEHVENYDIFLAEVKRVLKPDGIFFGSVPNLWCDETGKDPNPYHFHVFDWWKLKSAIDKYFIVDERWSQTAGGGYKLRDQKRSMFRVPLEEMGDVQSEWWLISATANPLTSNQIPYTNPFNQAGHSHSPALVNFENYYDNPWLYRVMIQLGERLADQNMLVNLCVKVIQESRLGSADQGAALCVMCYQLLESGDVKFNDVVTLINLINSYDSAFDRNNAHACRWAISLHYVSGRLLLAIGQRQEALTAFLACAEMDPLVFSPLLATKTISSRLYASLIYIGSNSLDDAKSQLKLGVKEAHRVLQGSWDNIIGHFDAPLPFGLQEAAEVLDIASQCVQVLHALEKQGAAPGYVWDKVNLKRFGLVEWNKSVERENKELRNMVESVLSNQRFAAAV